MSFKFTPKAESEMSSGFDNLPAGEYPFTVMESSIAISKSEKNAGREFIKVKLCVHGDGVDRHVYDMFADWFSEWKLKHFCEVADLRDEYLAGELNPGSNGWKDRQGYVKLKIAPARGEFPAKNEVVDYLPDDEQTCEALEKPVAKPAPAAPKAKPTPDGTAAADGSDDVPF